jgi:phage-related protein
LFGFFDGDDLIVLNHAFTKKTQKTPKKEIKITAQRKKEYFFLISTDLPLTWLINPW